MILRNIKLFLGFLVLITFISISVFGLFKFSHDAEVPMLNCPYTQGNFSICENSLSHINNWSQFLNVTPAFFVFLSIILGIVLYFFNKRNFLSHGLYFYRWKYYLDNKKLHFYQNKIIKWLSLFENSPSFSHMRHS